MSKRSKARKSARKAKPRDNKRLNAIIARIDDVEQMLDGIKQRLIALEGEPPAEASNENAPAATETTQPAPGA